MHCSITTDCIVQILVLQSYIAGIFVNHSTHYKYSNGRKIVGSFASHPLIEISIEIQYMHQLTLTSYFSQLGTQNLSFLVFANC